MPIERIWLQVHDAEVKAKAREEAIDEFATRLKQHLYPMSHGLGDCDIDEIAEQLKAGGKGGK